MSEKPRIAHLAGSNATIKNTPPLVTSNKARAMHGLPLRNASDGRPSQFDALRPQRLAAPATVYVEQFSAHPLERDASELYAPPDGWLDASGTFQEARRGPDDVPVYRIELRPEDGLYPLPYMARQADGSAWDDDGAFPAAPPEKSRQPYFPDGARLFEEIDRLGIGEDGTVNQISSRADVDFYRVLPSSGYTKGLIAAERTDIGDGDIVPEIMGRDFFAYRPVHYATSPPRPCLAQIVNQTQRILKNGDYDGAIWTQGSPRVEETLYWFNLLLDTTVPICGVAAQRTHGEISNDGPRNIVDAVAYIASRVWADTDGRNRVGMVLLQDQRVFSARDAQKGDARPGGYVTTGGHGGLLGSIPHGRSPVLTYLPAHSHSYLSAVNISRIPKAVRGIVLENGRIKGCDVTIKDSAGDLVGKAIPRVTIVKDGNYSADAHDSTLEREADVIAQIEANVREAPLSGFIIEGLSPYGTMTNNMREQLVRRAVFSGMPVARVGRGNNDGFAGGTPIYIGGGNLTATKARLLLMAALMKLGALPTAADPANPTDDERAATAKVVTSYQEIFDNH